MADASAVLVQSSQCNVPTVQTSTTALAANAFRSAWNIQNQATATLYVCLGAGASASQYHFILKGCTSAADGTGGSVGMESGSVYTGLITVYSASTPSYSCLEVGIN